MSEIKYMSAAEAARLIENGDHIYIQGSTSIPEVLVDAIADRGHELRDITVYSAFAVGRRPSPICRPEFKDVFFVDSFFVSNSFREWIAQGYGTMTPRFLGEVPALFRDGTCRVDVALINCSLPNERGEVSFGVSADLATSAVECADRVIAQINPHVPFTPGDAVIHMSQLSAAVEVDDPLVEVPTAMPTEQEIKIGNYIAELIPDGATLQIGVGGIPNAVIRALENHKNLGLHTEAMTDGVLPLLEKGIIDNSRKAVLPGKSVASLALGSKALYKFLDHNEDVLFKDVAWTNDPFTIARNPKVMSINSCLEIDLTGQVCADSIGKSISLPRPSYDGRFLMYNMTDHGTSPIHHADADLWIMDLSTGESRCLTEVNSDFSDAYHNWSPGGGWFLFNSKRRDGMYGNLYFSCIGTDGKATKPFMLPQRNPEQYYDEALHSFNAPDFITDKINLDMPHIRSMVKNNEIVNVSVKK